MCPRCVRPVAPTRPIDPGCRPDGGGAVASDNPFRDSGGRNTEPEDRETEDFDEEAWLAYLELLLQLPVVNPANLDELAQYVATTLAREPQHWEDYVSASSKDVLAWKVLSAMVDHLRRHDPTILRLPPLQDWILGVATGERQAPQGSTVRDTRLKRLYHFMIAVAVNDLCTLGTRRPSSTNHLRAESACHIVERRLELEYETVRWIYKRYRAAAQGEPGKGFESPLKVEKWLITPPRS